MRAKALIEGLGQYIEGLCRITLLKKCFLFVLAISLGCATLGTEITNDNNQIQMGHYSFLLPPNEGWHIKKTDDPLETAIVTNKIGPFVFEMRFLRNIIIDERMKASSVKTVANNYREFEKQIMIEQGVNKGLYQLNDVAMGEEKIGDKTFYIMNYNTISKSNNQRASLYLYFPETENNDSFIIAHYAESAPANAFLVKSYKPDFIKTLESLSINK